jgi:hypothetical protein
MTPSQPSPQGEGDVSRALSRKVEEYMNFNKFTIKSQEAV